MKAWAKPNNNPSDCYISVNNQVTLLSKNHYNSSNKQSRPCSLERPLASWRTRLKCPKLWNTKGAIVLFLSLFCGPFTLNIAKSDVTTRHRIQYLAQGYPYIEKNSLAPPHVTMFFMGGIFLPVFHSLNLCGKEVINLPPKLIVTLC